MPPAMRRRRRDVEAGRGPFNDRPLSIARTSASRPASPSLALACRSIRPSFECESSLTHSSKEGRIDPQPFTTSVGRTASRRGRGGCAGTVTSSGGPVPAEAGGATGGAGARFWINDEIGPIPAFAWYAHFRWSLAHDRWGLDALG